MYWLRYDSTAQLTDFDILLTDDANKEKVNSSIAVRNSVIIDSRVQECCMAESVSTTKKSTVLCNNLPVTAISGR